MTFNLKKDSLMLKRIFPRLFPKPESIPGKIKPGARVVRGPDWHYQYQDNGEGFLGTLVFQDKSDDYKVTVIWDSGRQLSYNASENNYDLRVFDTSSMGCMHLSVTCGSCGSTPIYGMRWKCKPCKDINLCTRCYMNDKHEVKHAFDRIDTPQSTRIPLTPRLNFIDKKITARGICVGAEVIRGPHWDFQDVDGNDVGYVRGVSRKKVMVLWKASETLTACRVGKEGCVDVIYSRMTESASDGDYYADHLPVVDFRNIDYSVGEEIILTSTTSSGTGNKDFVIERSTVSVDKTQRTIKCVLVGDGCCGKTQLIISYLETPEQLLTEKIFDNYSVTIIINGEPFALGLYDTAGQEDYDKLRPLSYPGTDVFIVCFSIASPASFENVKEKWIPEITHFTKNVPFILVGTEIDCREDEAILKQLAKKNLNPITRRQGETLALDIRATKYVECSLLTQDGVHDVFNEAIFAALNTKTEQHKKRCVMM